MKISRQGKFTELTYWFVKMISALRCGLMISATLSSAMCISITSAPAHIY